MEDETRYSIADVFGFSRMTPDLVQTFSEFQRDLIELSSLLPSDDL